MGKIICIKENEYYVAVGTILWGDYFGIDNEYINVWEKEEQYNNKKTFLPNYFVMSEHFEDVIGEERLTILEKLNTIDIDKLQEVLDIMFNDMKRYKGHELFPSQHCYYDTIQQAIDIIKEMKQ